VTSGSLSGACAQSNAATGYFTQYVYSGDLLTQVNQNIQSGGGGSQSRTMTYDGLGRKLSETLPETGTSKFAYDSDASSHCTGAFPGDQVRSTDALGNVVCAQYDNQHRLQSTSTVLGPYAGVTPNLNYVYDAATVNGVAMRNVAGAVAEAYTCSGSCTGKITDVGFSAMAETTGGTLTGRTISQMYESTPHSNGYTVTQATAYPNGSMAALSGYGSSFTMPSIVYGVDGKGRPATAADTTNQLNLVSSTLYNSAGATTLLNLGNGDSDSRAYDSVYQPNGFTFNVAAGNPFSVSGALTLNANGSIHSMSISDSGDSSRNQSCVYSADDLNRLSSANCGSLWSQTFAYDPFGNIAKSANGGITYGAGYGANNQVTGGTIASYDANGNQTQNTAGGFTWNAAGQVVSTNAGSGAQATYDALGRMVETVSGSTVNQFIYSPLGTQYAVIQNGTLARGMVPLPGGDTAVYNSGGLNYIRRTDLLGSSRLATTWAHAVYSKDAYAPYGEPYDETSTPDRSFTGQGEDLAQNVGLDDFLFRKLDTTAGRWLSPDPSGWNAVDLSDPQTLNRYAYVRNSPLTSVDPLGLHEVILNWMECTTVNFYASSGVLINTEQSCVPHSVTIDLPDDASGYIPVPDFGGRGFAGLAFGALVQPQPVIKKAPSKPLSWQDKVNIGLTVLTGVNLPSCHTLDNVGDVVGGVGEVGVILTSAAIGITVLSGPGAVVAPGLIVADAASGVLWATGGLLNTAAKHGVGCHR
jgi:RHS repeat-associated protein